MRILITGAARAIGAATAHELSQRGHEVIATARDPKALAEVNATLKLALDVTNGQASPVCAGGLQEQAIRDQICRVMEGGPEAFRERYRRIAQGDGDV